MKPWTAFCQGCGRERECQSRYEHAARVLCDECASRTPLRNTTTSASPDCLSSSLGVLGRSGESSHRSRERRSLGALDEFTCSPEWAVRAAGLWGVRTDLGAGFECPVPGHREHGCEASLVPMPDGRILMLDTFRDDAGTPTRARKLADVHAQVVSGRPFTPSPTISVEWLFRLAADAGFMELPDLAAPLPDVALRPEEYRQFTGLLLLLRVRQAAGDLGAIAPAYSRRFAQDWTGASEWEARTGWEGLRSRNVVHGVGAHVGEGKHRRSRLWLPAPYTDPRQLFGEGERPPLRVLDGGTCDEAIAEGRRAS